MTIELSKAHVGQRYVARDGEVWSYVRPEDGIHVLSDRHGDEASFRPDGLSARKSDDLVRALDEPAPAPSEAEDAGHGGEFGQATDDPDLLAWLTREHEKLVARFPDIEYIAGSSDTIFSVAATRLEALSGDNEALRSYLRAIAECRHPTGDGGKFATKGTLRDYAVEALTDQPPRDWHSKHDGGGNG